MRGTTWFLIADASRSRLFEHRTGETGLTQLFEDDQPDLRDRTLRGDSDRPGRVHESSGSVRHGMESHTSVEEHDRELYARSVIEKLDEAAKDHAFARLVLVAPPHMLGALRSHMPHAIAEKVVAELHKELARMAEPDLRDHLREWM